MLGIWRFDDGDDGNDGIDGDEQDDIDLNKGSL